MNWVQIGFLFDVERTSEGYPKLIPPSDFSPSPRKLFERHCFLNGVTDEQTVESLWQAKQEAKRRPEK